MIITLPQSLQEKLGPEGAKALVDALNSVESSYRSNTLELAEEKFERRLTEEIGGVNENINEKIASLRQELKDDISNVREELKEDIFSVRQELKEDIANVRQELKEDIYNVRISLIKWMVTLLIAQTALLVSLFSFLR